VMTLSALVKGLKRLLSSRHPQEDTVSEALLVVDRQSALQAFNGNHTLYETVERAFLAMAPDLQKLAKAQADGDYEQVLTIVHTYVSALAYLGAYALSEKAKALEVQLKQEGSLAAPKTQQAITSLITHITVLTERQKV